MNNQQSGLLYYYNFVSYLLLIMIQTLHANKKRAQQNTT